MQCKPWDKQLGGMTSAEVIIVIVFYSTEESVEMLFRQWPVVSGICYVPTKYEIYLLEFCG